MSTNKIIAKHLISHTARFIMWQNKVTLELGNFRYQSFVLYHWIYIFNETSNNMKPSYVNYLVENPKKYPTNDPKKVYSNVVLWA